ncbi:MAG TPA: high-potential iron-sulfur protein [Luteolibacter sp.]|nr:high-potential iron-sulfur protein [Luteolibacter sp.]
MNTRRHFLRKLAITASAPLVIASQLGAEETPPPPPEKVPESDPVATAFGYKEDTTKVDQQKYPQHKPEQRCDNCLHYTGKPGEATGPCAIFQNRLVTAEGWCMAYVIKPAAPATPATPPTPPAAPRLE